MALGSVVQFPPQAIYLPLWDLEKGGACQDPTPRATCYYSGQGGSGDGLHATCGFSLSCCRLENPAVGYRALYLCPVLSPEVGVEGGHGDLFPRFLRGLSKALGGTYPSPHSTMSCQ